MNYWGYSRKTCMGSWVFTSLCISCTTRPGIASTVLGAYSCYNVIVQYWMKLLVVTTEVEYFENVCYISLSKL
jgi:hypothetical protein